ncbi:MAG: hypothetical protein GEU71_18440 [Actinobacteria bacterium]|nr:hypothetical protein [Actinomycetota bacterium]
MDSISATSGQVEVRRAKRNALFQMGSNPYPVTVPRTHSLRQIRDQNSTLEVDEHSGEYVGATGRVIFLRNSGKLCFAALREGSEAELQIMLSALELGAESLSQWKGLVDVGDHVFVEGEVIMSRRGELSVLARSWRVTAKALRPIPTKARGLSDENRVRQRYLDLIVRPESRQVARTRAWVIRTLRDMFHERDFMELETPMLQHLHGGAAA